MSSAPRTFVSGMFVGGVDDGELTGREGILQKTPNGGDTISGIGAHETLLEDLLEFAARSVTQSGLPT